MGYEDTKQKILSTLMQRPNGTEIQPSKHQDFALNLLEYIRSVELISGSTLIGIAYEDTTPVQSNTANATYISGVAQQRNVVYENFIDKNGEPISVTTGEMEAKLVILFWNRQYWEKQEISANIVSQSSEAYFYYTLTIRKTYDSISSMQGDVSSPVGEDGRNIKRGEIVSVISENALYSYECNEDGEPYWKEQLKISSDKDIFKQANLLTNSVETSVLRNNPSKISVSLNSCILGYLDENIILSHLNTKANNAQYFTLDWEYMLKNVDEFYLHCDIPENVSEIIFGYKYKEPFLFTEDFRYKDETFDTKGYDSMFLVRKNQHYGIKRLSEKINKHDEEVFISSLIPDWNPMPLYIKGNNLYNNYSQLSGYIHSNGYYCVNNELLKYEFINDLSGIGNSYWNEALFNLFPGYYFKWVNIEEDNRLTLLFKRTDYLFEEDGVTINPCFKEEIMNLVIPNISFDLFFKYKI